MSADRLRGGRTVPALGEALEFLRLLWELDHSLQRRSKRMSKERGLTGPQSLVLRMVGRFPGIPAGELAELLHLHPSTLTGIVARLESGGWLTRRPDPRDRRRMLLGLTERGRALDAADPVSPEASLERVLARSPARDVEAARSVLKALAGELGSEEGGRRE